MLVEIGRIEPALKGGADAGPFFRNDRIPGGIAAPALVDNRAPEDPLEGKSISLCSQARGSIQAVALPFVAAVAQIFEDIAGEEVHWGNRIKPAVSGVRALIYCK